MSINFPNDPATNPGNGGSWTDPDGNVWIVEIVAGEAIWTMQEAEISEEPVIEWTLTANGSTDYIFSGTGFAGTETDPVVYVVRGQTYKFTNGMGAHPFQIQSTPGTSGTAYNDGITNNAVSNGTLTWEVRMDAPSTLYYQCTSHADMNGTIYVLDEGSSVASIDDLGDVDTSTAAPTDGQALLWDAANNQWEPGTVSSGGTSLPSGSSDGEALIWENGAWAVGPVIGGVDYFTGAGDQYISNVALLMNFEGTDGTQVFTDSSPNNLTLTPNGSASNLKISTTEFKYGSSSGYFFQSYLTASSTIAFNSDPFTVEAWIHRVSGQSYSSSTGWTYGAMEGDIYSARPGITFKINGADQLEFFRGNVATPVITSTTTIPLGVWTHVAVTRDSSDVVTLWIDGVSSATQTYVDTNGVGYDLGTGGTPAIGRRNGSSTSYFFGYIDDLRVTPGICRYTADFTPPTGQLSSQVPNQTTIPYSIDKLEDVDTSTVAPTDGQALLWDNTAQKWEPGTVSSGGTSLPAAQDGEALIYENGQWVAGPVIGGVNYSTSGNSTYTPPSGFTYWQDSFTIEPASAASSVLLTNNDLTAEENGGSSFERNAVSTTTKNTGKWYWEITIDVQNTDSLVGITANPANGFPGDSNTGGIGFYRMGQVYNNSGATASNNSAFVTGDVVMLALDADAKKLWYGVNGTWDNSGDPAAGTGALATNWTGTPDWYFAVRFKAQGGEKYSLATGATTTTIPYSIDKLVDVDTSTVAPTDGQALLWDNAAGKWEPGTVSGGGGTSLPAAQDGEALIYENGQWVAGPVIGGVDYTISSGSQTSTYPAPTGYTHWNDTWTLGLGSPHSGFTVSADGLTVTFGGGSEQNAGSSTAYSSGKYYVEIETTAGVQMQVGLSQNLSGVWHHSTALGVQPSSGYANTYVGGTSVPNGTINAASSGDVLMLAVDFDNKKLFYGINGTWENSGDPVAGTGEVISGWNTADYYFGVRNHSVGGVQTAIKHNYILTNSVQVTSAYSIDKLDDVDTSTVAPTDGQALLWDAANSKWEPGTVSASGSGSGGGGLTTSTPWAPSDLTLSMWLDADDASTITETGGAVSAWSDKTTNAFNVAQATAANQPTLTANGLNGKSVITFDGTNDYLSVPPSIQTQPMTIALVCKANSTAASGGGTGRAYVFDGMGTSTTGRALLALDGDNNGYAGIYAGGTGLWVTDSTATFDTNAHIFVLNFNGASSSLKFDGGTAATGTLDTLGLTNGVTLGANYNQTGDWFNGAIAEFIVLPAASTDDQQKLEGYLAHKWGLESSLPAGHPYKSAAPVNESTTSLPSGTADGEALIWENGAWAVGPVIGGVNYSSAGDADFSSVELLLLGNGTNGSTTITDSSNNALTVTANGNTQISTTQAKFGGASIYFDGTGDYLSIPNQSWMGFGTNLFTIETWLYINANSTSDSSGSRPATLVANYPSSGTTSNGWLLHVLGDSSTTGTGLEFYGRDSSGNIIHQVTYSGTISQSAWHHVAVVRETTAVKLYLDGAEVASTTLTASDSFAGVHPLYVATNSYSNWEAYLNGYIDDLRITSGVARYTANFTPPTTELPTASGAPVAIPYSIDNLDDVDTSTVAPTDGQALLWDNTASKWEPGSIAAGTSIENARTETFTYEVTLVSGNNTEPTSPGDITVRGGTTLLWRVYYKDKAGKDLLLTDEYSSPTTITMKRNGTDETYTIQTYNLITQYVSGSNVNYYFQFGTAGGNYALGDTFEFTFTRPAEGDYAALKADLTSYETVNGDVVRGIKPNDKLLTAASTVGHVYDSFQAGSPGTPTADGQYALRWTSSTPIIRVWPNDTNGNAFDLRTVSYTGATGSNQKPFFYAWANGILYKIPISSQIYSQSGYYQWYCAGGASELSILQNAGSFRIVLPWEAYEDPQDGDVLTYNSTNKTYHPKAASGGSSTRTQVSGTTASIADGASADLTISGTGKAGQLLSIETDAAAWVTLYVSQATRTADASRSETTDPSPGSGVLAEVITTGAQTVLSTPSTAFFNNEATPASELYLKVVNKSGASAAISVTLKVIPIEV